MSLEQDLYARQEEIKFQLKTIRKMRKNIPRMYALSDSQKIVKDIITNLMGYTFLAISCPESIPYVVGINISTNIINGIYGWIKNRKKRIPEKYSKKSLEEISEA